VPNLRWRLQVLALFAAGKIPEGGGLGYAAAYGAESGKQPPRTPVPQAPHLCSGFTNGDSAGGKRRGSLIRSPHANSHGTAK